jgi:hypothetical protein
MLLTNGLSKVVILSAQFLTGLTLSPDKQAPMRSGDIFCRVWDICLSESILKQTVVLQLLFKELEHSRMNSNFGFRRCAAGHHEDFTSNELIVMKE